MRKKILVLSAVICVLLSAIGCSSKKNTEVPQNNAATEEPAVTVTEAPTAEPVPTEDPHIGMAKSLLTGKYIPEKEAAKRPYAVMINNIEYAARFHSGISKASILYEAKVEGGITRLMGIFENLNTTKLGSVRSARHYYVSVASEYDAVFVHFGHTKFALSKIDKLNVDNISGLSGYGGKVFYRDNSISAPHNAFTSSKGLAAGMSTLKYHKKYKDNFEGHFTFYDEDTDLADGKDADKVTVKFSGYASPYFVYDADKKVYKRYQYGKKHIDTANNRQLAFKNLIIQYVDDEPIVPGHAKDYRTINFENASGKGVYITNGKAVNITWKKNESKKMMKYYNKDGSELIINPGKTYVALFPDNGSKLTISGKKKG